MKLFLATAALLLSTQFAQASDYEQVACDTLRVSAEEDCHEALMEQCATDGRSRQECEDSQDGDYAVAHQECTWTEMSEVLIPQHNAANPNRPAITCEDY